MGWLILATIATISGWVWLAKEIKQAPEMYFDSDGYFRPLEWFESNNETSEMYYDFERTEKFDYDLIKRGADRDAN